MKPPRLVLEAEDSPTELPLEGLELSLGRESTNGIVLDDPRVSRRHALIRALPEGDYLLVDLGSSNGTYLNDKKLALPSVLRCGDRIRVGSTTLRFLAESSEAPDEAREDDEGPSTTFVEDAAPGLDLVGSAAAMDEVFKLAERAGSSPIPVLITGETGTGKELLARGIHASSKRAAGPFVAINCAAMPEALLESELFGHRRGAFTGAINDHRGLFEAASGGTLFLDEVGEMPVAMQAKLLRALQEGAVTPLGDTRPRKTDARILSATNRDLEAEVEKGAFRADLYYRLAALTIRMPALRERREDIPLIARRLVRVSASRQAKSINGIAPDAMAVLQAYDWPGNVRELQNVIDRAIALARDGATIDARHLPPLARAASTTAAAGRDVHGGTEPGRPDPGSDVTQLAVATGTRPASEDLRDARAAFEAEHIARVLEQHRGNVARAARALGLSRTSLHKKIREYGIREERS
ncbi:MAG: sigma 54-interacting transcriptional regulator [Thermodesulfobacteriota bacterium]